MIRFDVKDNQVRLRLDRVVDGLDDLESMFDALHAVMTARVDATFERAGGPGSAVVGGTDPARGLSWAPFAPRYTRRDGVVPAWGMRPRVDDPGRYVRPRRRPSGAFVTPASLLAQDTGRLRQRATTGRVESTPNSLRFGPGLPYAARQNELREFLTITDGDADALLDVMYDRLLGG